MRIAMLLSNGFRPDVRVIKEAQSLTALGHSVHVICWDRAAEFPPIETLPGGAEIRRVQQVRSGYGLGARQLARIPLFWRAAFPHLDHLNPDLVHCHDFDTLPAGLWWGKIHHKPVVYDAHEYYADLCKPRLHGLSGNLLYRAIRLAEQWGARQAAAIVTVDELLAERYRRHNRTVVILGHYPQRQLAVEPNPVFSRPEMSLLYAGRLSVDRGLLVYAALLRALHERGIPARLRLAGVFTPASDEQVFREHIDGLEHWVEFLGWVPYGEMAGVLRSADVGLSILLPEPRYVVAQPVKLYEYMAAGLPVIASNFPSIAQVLHQSDCGVTVDPLGGIGQLADTLASWWANPATPRHLGEKGRQAVLVQYNWETLIGQLVHVYQSLIHPEASPPPPQS